MTFCFIIRLIKQIKQIHTNKINVSLLQKIIIFTKINEKKKQNLKKPQNFKNWKITKVLERPSSQMSYLDHFLKESNGATTAGAGLSNIYNNASAIMVIFVIFKESWVCS